MIKKKVRRVSIFRPVLQLGWVSEETDKGTCGNLNVSTVSCPGIKGVPIHHTQTLRLGPWQSTTRCIAPSPPPLTVTHSVPTLHYTPNAGNHTVFIHLPGAGDSLIRYSGGGSSDHPPGCLCLPAVPSRRLVLCVYKGRDKNRVGPVCGGRK